MHEMKYDMAGAATVLGVFSALASLKLDANVIATGHNLDDSLQTFLITAHNLFQNGTRYQSQDIIFERLVLQQYRNWLLPFQMHLLTLILRAPRALKLTHSLRGYRFSLIVTMTFWKRSQNSELHADCGMT